MHNSDMGTADESAGVSDDAAAAGARSVSIRRLREARRACRAEKT